MSVEFPGMLRCKRMVNDAALLSKPSVLEKLEEDSIKADQILSHFWHDAL